MIIRSQGLHLDYTELLGVLAILLAAIMHALSYVITKRQGADIGVITFNTLPIGIAGLGLFMARIKAWVGFTLDGLAAFRGCLDFLFRRPRRVKSMVDLGP